MGVCSSSSQPFLYAFNLGLAFMDFKSNLFYRLDLDFVSNPFNLSSVWASSLIFGLRDFQ